MFNQARILLTGGSGFIGTNLVDYLVRFNGVEILNLDILPPNKRSHDIYWKQCDILNSEKLVSEFLDFMPSHVIHLAARTDLDEKRSLDGYQVNISGTENLLKAVNRTDSVQRVIVTSSMLVNRIGETVSSYADYSPANFYGQSKVLTETITKQFGLQKEWLIIRPTTVWGPWNFVHVNGFFRVIRKGMYVHPGGKSILKSYGYVGNVVHQIVRLLEEPSDKVHKKTFYVGDPPMDLRLWTDKFSRALCGRKTRTAPLVLLRYIAAFGDILGMFHIRFPLTSFRLGNMTVDNIIDMTDTLAVTGPSPYSLVNGVRETIKWLQRYEGDQRG